MKFNKNDYPKYSVLMSIYYKENPSWFKDSIESMLNQSVLCDEFVIVEDGKLTESLYKVVDEYKKKYPKTFKIIKIKENQGLGLALKLGVENCRNEWIARMDSDDYSIPTRCEKELEKILENPELDIVGSCIGEFISNINNVVSYRKLPETDEEIKKFAKRRNPFGHPSVMIRKSKILEANNYRDYYLCEDYDMWIRMIEVGAQCYNFQEVLTYMRINNDFYKRRGGKKYLKSILKFKKEQYKKGFYSRKDFFLSSTAHIIVCLLPNNVRDFVYRKLLRSSK